MLLPTPSPTTVAVLVDHGLPKSVVDSFAIAGTIATALGVLIALYVAFSGAWRQRKADFQDQASRVSVYIDSRPGYQGFNAYPIVVIINASTSPIYEVIVGAGVIFGGMEQAFFGGNEKNYMVTSVPPGAYYIAYPKGLRSGKTGTDRYGNEVEVPDGLRRAPTVTFRDRNGTAWQRNPEGSLAVVKAENLPVLRGLSEPLPWTDIKAM